MKNISLDTELFTQGRKLPINGTASNKKEGKKRRREKESMRDHVQAILMFSDYMM